MNKNKNIDHNSDFEFSTFHFNNFDTYSSSVTNVLYPKVFSTFHFNKFDAYSSSVN